MPSYSVTTRATLRTRVQERLITNFWGTTELNTIINEALRLWGSLTGFYRQRSTVTFTANQADYDVTSVVDPACYAVLRMDLSTSHLDPLDLQEQSQFNPTWQAATAATATGWIPLGLNKVALYPVITGNATGVAVDNLYFAPLPANDAAYIQVGEEDMDALVDYCQFVATIKEGGDELKASLPLLNNFLKQAAKYNSRLLASAVFRRILGMPGGGQLNTRPTDKESQSPR